MVDEAPLAEVEDRFGGSEVPDVKVVDGAPAPAVANESLEGGAVVELLGGDVATVGEIVRFSTEG